MLNAAQLRATLLITSILASGLTLAACDNTQETKTKTTTTERTTSTPSGDTATTTTTTQEKKTD